MPQQPAIAVSTQDASAKLDALRAIAGELKLQISDLETRRGQLAEQRARLDAKADPSALNKQAADLQHQITAAAIQLENTNHQIQEVQAERDMARAFGLQNPPGAPGAPIAITAPPDPFLGPEQITTIYTGGIVLLLPLVLVLARRLWVRSPRREPLDLENSPRLQRIEQAVESIALEVERIGEAQRFTTKLLADRQGDAARMPAVPRREPGTITPH
jgi:DNA repair exonuclease SbcCD ATPase subunit